MATILILETATEVCSVALSVNGEPVALAETGKGQNHARLLGVFMQQILEEHRLLDGGIDAVAVSLGPGSYTGLRIGVSTAKGFCYARQIPLIAVSTLQAMSEQVRREATAYGLQPGDEFLLCPMMDARRMEVYTAMYNQNGDEVKPVSAQVVTHESFLPELEAGKVLFFGNGSAKCRELITHPNALFLNGVNASAQFMCGLSETAWQMQHFVDVAYFEPFYLKDFVATVPKNSVLGTQAGSGGA